MKFCFYIRKEIRFLREKDENEVEEKTRQTREEEAQEKEQQNEIENCQVSTRN